MYGLSLLPSSTMGSDELHFQKRSNYSIHLPVLGCEKKPSHMGRAQCTCLEGVLGASRNSDQPALCVTLLCFPDLLSPAIGRLFCRLIIASPTARKEIFLCNKNSFGVFYSLLIHAKQESMTHCLLWLQKIQMKDLNVLRQLCSQSYHNTFLTEHCFCLKRKKMFYMLQT